MCAVEWTKGHSDILINILNIHPDFPIVAHSVDYNLDGVLTPTFERVGNIKNLLGPERWICTQELARYLPGLESMQLDDVL